MIEKLKGMLQWWRLSPTQLNLWERDPRGWFQQYLFGARTGQNVPMAIGSYVDSVHKAAVCELAAEPLIQKTVELKTEEVFTRGKAIWDWYVSNGHLAVFKEAAAGMGEACEKTVILVEGVRVTIVPDYIVRDVVIDLKCATSERSPKKGYVWDSKTGLPHKEVVRQAGGWRYGYDAMGILYDHKDWAAQLLSYSLYRDSRYIMVEEIMPNRVAVHCVEVEEAKRQELQKRYVRMWDMLNTSEITTRYIEEISDDSGQDTSARW